MKNLVFLLLTFISLGVSSQNCFKGKIEELQQLKDRKLIVLVLEEQSKEVKRLTVQISKTKKTDKKNKLQKELNSLSTAIKSFNKIIKEIVPQYWNLNNTSDVLYLTKKEIENLKDKKSNQYAILDLSADEIAVKKSHSFVTLFKFNYNLITYGASENQRSKASYRNHMVNTNYNFPKTRFKNKDQKALLEKLEKEFQNDEVILLSKENLIVTLVIAQSAIEAVLESGKKVSFSKFAQQESDNNCNLLKGNKILIQSAIIGSKAFKNLSEYKDKVTLVSAKRIGEAIINKENVFIGFPVIKQFVKTGGGFVLGINTIDHKLVFNPSTGKIVSFLKASMPLNYRSFKRKEIDKIFKCN